MFEEFDTVSVDPEDYTHTMKKKFDSGTTVVMSFWITEFDRLDDTLYVEVGLASYSKRKQQDTPDFQYTSRGKDGLRPAIWATDLLLKFPAFLLEDRGFRHKNRVVYTIYWSNTRRRDIYHKWLSRYGFYFDYSHGEKCISKVFVRPEQ